MQPKSLTILALAVLVAVGSAGSAWANGQTESREDPLTKQSIQQFYDELDYQRAVQAYLWSIPAMYTYSLRKALVDTFGATPHTNVPIWEDLMDNETVMLTPNSQVVYVFNFLDLKKDGPTVLEAPPKLAAMLDSMWDQPIIDIGATGPDKGQGGKFLVLPPGYEGDVPEDYFVARSPTYGVMVVLRGYIENGSTANAVARLKQTRIYPLAQKDNPPETTFLNVSGKPVDTMFPTDEGLFYNLADLVQQEHVADKDKIMYGMLATNLGKFAACRRVARAIYMGSAPTASAAHRGIEDRRVKLGCVLPGESPAVFGDALRRLAGAATYLYQDGPRYWYSTQPTVTKLAEDRAELLNRDPDKVAQELDRRLRADLRKTGDFSRIHPMPQSSQDVPDDLDARLVVLGIDHAYSKEPGSAAEAAAKSIHESRGNTPRLYRNTLVFLAADKMRLQDLDEAARRYLAWESILMEKETLDLSPHQVKQAETQKASADSVVTARLPETYQWLLAPVQISPQDAIEWQAFRLSGQDALAVRASKKLRSEELLVTSFAATRLRMELDRVLWRGNHVEIKQLVEDFARFLYLPRLHDPEVLLGAVRDGLALLTWEQDAFAYAESYDEEVERYRGLRSGQQVSMLDSTTPGLLVKSDVARDQIDDETSKPDKKDDDEQSDDSNAQESAADQSDDQAGASSPTRFHGSVALDATRVGRDASRVADEVIAHLAGLVGATVTVVLEIQADIPGGAPDHVVRTVTENSRTLKFSSQGFESES